MKIFKIIGCIVLLALVGCSGGGESSTLGSVFPSDPASAVAPTAPSGLSATTASSSQINLAWTDNSSNETGFKIERKTGTTGAYVQIATTSANATSYSDTALTVSTTYNYRIRATNSVGDSGYTTEVSATPQANGAGTSPTGVTATAVGTSINLTWNPVANAISYKVYWGTSTGISKSSTQISNITSPSYQHTNRTIGTIYYYVVTAYVSGFVDGPVSTEVSAQNIHYAREIEVNNTTATATAIIIAGDAVRGQLSSDTDVDYYTFNSTGGVVSFSIKTDDTVPAQYSNTYIKASIIASDGTTVLSSISNISEDTTQFYPLSANLPVGSYYLKFEKNPNSQGFRKDYVVSSSYNSTMNREVEPNNGLISATPMTIDSGSIRGQLSSDTDVDYYSFTSTGGAISFSLSSDYTVPAQYSNTYVKASILASDGATVLSSINISESTTQIYPLSANLVAGTYYLRFEKNENSQSFSKDYIVTY